MYFILPRTAEASAWLDNLLDRPQRPGYGSLNPFHVGDDRYDPFGWMPWIPREIVTVTISY
jgi:hypothetical protein